MKLKIASLIMVVIFVLSSFTAVFADSSWTIEETFNYLYHGGTDFDHAPVKIIAIGIDSLLYQYELREDAPSTGDYLFQNALGDYFVKKDGPVDNLSKSDIISFFEDVKAEMQALNEEEAITERNLNDKTLAALQKAVALPKNSGVKSALINLFANGLNVETELKKIADSSTYQKVYNSLVFDTDKDIWDLIDDNAPRPSKPSSGGSSGRRTNSNTKPAGTFNGETTSPALYNDIAADHWAYEYVEKLSKAGVVNGTGNQKFEPDADVTRAAFVKMLAVTIGAQVSATPSKFVDVEYSAWYNPYVAWGVENGIINGYSDTEFGPEDSITREQMAAMVLRFAEKFNVTLPANTAKAAFADDAAISAYAYDAVYAMQTAGLINGDENNAFKPAANATRAETAKVVSLVYDMVK